MGYFNHDDPDRLGALDERQACQQCGVPLRVFGGERANHVCDQADVVRHAEMIQSLRDQAKVSETLDQAWRDAQEALRQAKNQAWAREYEALAQAQGTDTRLVSVYDWDSGKESQESVASLAARTPGLRLWTDCWGTSGVLLNENTASFCPFVGAQKDPNHPAALAHAARQAADRDRDQAERAAYCRMRSILDLPIEASRIVKAASTAAEAVFKIRILATSMPEKTTGRRRATDQADMLDVCRKIMGQ